MSEITQKPQKDDALNVIKNKNEMLLTRVESFTSKEVSEVCRGMDEKLLERTALMCERISSLRENPSGAALVIANLSKHKESNEETLNTIMEKMEASPNRFFLQNAERLSRTVSPEQFLKSIPFIERLSNWNRRVISPTVRIDEDRMLLATSELITSVGEGVGQCMELGRTCLEKEIDPEHLYQTFISLMKKHPTREQFDIVVDEFSKILATLKPEYDTVPQAALPEIGEEKVFAVYKPEWTLKSFYDKVQYSTVEGFIDHLTDFERKNDPFQKATSIEDGSEPFQNFKGELRSCLGWHAGAIAFAKKMAEDSDFCRLIGSSLSERRSKGYYDLIYYTDLFDPIEMLNVFKAYEGKPTIPHYPPDVAEKTGGYPELQDITRVRYSDLKKVAEFYPEVMGEVSALETIWAEYQRMLETRITTFTPHQDIQADELSKAIASFLELIKEKHLFEGPVTYLDVGTASGAFSRKNVKYMEKNFDSPRILLTNPMEIEMKEDLKKYEKIYDVTRGPVGELLLPGGKVHIVVVKDMMKFFEETSRGAIWSNVTAAIAEGGVAFSGSTLYIPHESAYKQHVMHNGELVKVDWTKFVEEVKKVKDYQDYLMNLDGILKRSREA